MTDLVTFSDIENPQEIAVGRSLWGDALHRLTRDRAAAAAFAIIVVYAILAIVGGFFYDHFINSTNYAMRNQPPSAHHWLGTDIFGRDVLLKTLLGARVSMTVGLMSNVIAIPLGMVLGAIAGYFGRRVDDVVVWFYTTLASIPGIMLLIALKYAFHDGVLFRDVVIWKTSLAIDLSGIHGLYIALGVVSWIYTCRVVRAETLKLKELDYVTAARALGEGHCRILFVHIMPNLLHLAIILFSLGFVGAITAEVILSFLGLGVEVGTPSWGTMINAARMDLVVGRWWEVTAACTAMFFIVLALNVFGDRLRDALDPKLRM
jgi:peptide/nickel transport system permease protein